MKKYPVTASGSITIYIYMFKIPIYNKAYVIQKLTNKRVIITT